LLGRSTLINSGEALVEASEDFVGDGFAKLSEFFGGDDFGVLLADERGRLPKENGLPTQID
jgi:hypothetical protein